MIIAEKPRPARPFGADCLEHGPGIDFETVRRIFGHVSRRPDGSHDMMTDKQSADLPVRSGRHLGEQGIVGGS